MRQYNAAQLDGCTDAQVASGSNVCFIGSSHEDTVNVLAHAAFVKRQMEEKGWSEAQAMRDLGVRIRRAQGIQDRTD